MHQKQLNIKYSHPLNFTVSYIKFYWQIDTGVTAPRPLRQLVLPSLHIDLIFILQGSLSVNGIHVKQAFASPVLLKWKEIELEPYTALFGIRFNPIAFFQLADLELHELKQSPNFLKQVFSDRKYYDLNTRVIEEETFEARVKTLDSHFSNSFSQVGKVNTSLFYTLKCISNNPKLKVEDIASTIGYSERWMQKKYKREIGISPCKAIQILRFNRAMAILANNSVQRLSEVSYLAGYSDQSHFIRDFKKFSSHTPKCFSANLPEFFKIMNGV